jgi:hypothetical protein
MYTRCTVTSGSTITFFPLANCRIKGFVVRTCSAINGETFDLIPPVPNPMTTIATISPGNAAPRSIDHGNDVRKSTTIPIMYTIEKYLMVAYLPRNWSATIAPRMGVT